MAIPRHRVAVPQRVLKEAFDLAVSEELKALALKNDGTKPMLEIRNESSHKLKIGVGIENDQLVIVIRDQS